MQLEGVAVRPGRERKNKKGGSPKDLPPFFDAAARAGVRENQPVLISTVMTNESERIAPKVEKRITLDVMLASRR